MKKDDIELQPLDLPGGGKSLITWSRPLWLAGADPKRPIRLEVVAPIRAPNAKGMAEEGEAMMLGNIDHKLEALVVKKFKGAYAMRIEGGGKHLHIFYLPERVGLVRKRETREALPDAIAAVGAEFGWELKTTFEDDPGWSRLLALFSSHDPNQWLHDRGMMVAMAKANDAIHGRRQVIHKAYFNAREDARDFLRNVRKLRFKPKGGPRDAKPGKPGKLLVVLERSEPTIATWHLHATVLSVKELVIAHNGTYDDWECDFIENIVPPPLTAPRGG